ncbi:MULTISPECIES: hypothetical protein [unclassified Rhizobium]|uniref:hypothetical protein n=1 Tax=unclassified Rhizobium TaxID=2613769 RepID=UPI001ADAE25D|nr:MULTISPECIES: hypothetical protein [unclassified Rhizobium]MBO9097205.1 hypothetical protein [Rhizobium sp. L58/93]MBO9133944.1 hypothetical protein [Rhizobium sp. B209b/85]MBO9167443.1 hypothetical protein [Rhizobium sp. L245/93]MBO9183402.1 hypothetical protein [Rhizobium sp. E27B/91]QXZ83738.1 hypothetical protein J5287_17165 [Rhizobium sp. K1/93]
MAELSAKVYEKVKNTGVVIRLSQNLPYTGNVPVSAEAAPPVFGQPSEVKPHRRGEGVVHDSGNEGNDA